MGRPLPETHRPSYASVLRDSRDSPACRMATLPVALVAPSRFAAAGVTRALPSRRCAGGDPHSRSGGPRSSPKASHADPAGSADGPDTLKSDIAGNDRRPAVPPRQPLTTGSVGTAAAHGSQRHLPRRIPIQGTDAWYRLPRLRPSVRTRVGLAVTVPRANVLFVDHRLERFGHEQIPRGRCKQRSRVNRGMARLIRPVSQAGGSPG